MVSKDRAPSPFSRKAGECRATEEGESTRLSYAVKATSAARSPNWAPPYRWRRT